MEGYLNSKRNYQMSNEILPCPFCGHILNIDDDDDILYPINRERDIWNIVCSVVSGGCDASILADSPADAIRKWNTRAK